MAGALRAVTYTDVSDVPNTVDRTISFVINDGTLSSVASTKTVSVTAVNDVPVAHDDAFTTLETTALSGGNLFANNGASSDDPDDGSAFSVTAVNGSTANVGHEITLASGGHLTVSANGTFSYDPNHAFDYVPVSSSGASNTPATDQFTYTITGGSAATVTLIIAGVDSDDILQGTAGPDTLFGGIGNDTLVGGVAADTMVGGVGNDGYSVDNAGDAVIENANEGTDTVNATIHYGLGANVENLVLQGSADLQGYGNSQANTITGNVGNNLLDGGTGADVMVGGAGNDTYFVDNANDAISENPGAGSDVVLSTAHYGLSADVETLVLQGSADLQGYGNGLNNSIYGNSGNNLLNGGSGADLMVGGAGNDTYFVDDANDAVFESPGAGADAVFSTAHYGLSADVETLVLQGSADLQGYGNGLNNSIYGNAGSNLLNGGAGADVMVGGAGNDTYFVDNASDAVVENAGEGSDAVFSTAHYGLSTGVETLVLQGGADLQGYGNGGPTRSTATSATICSTATLVPTPCSAGPATTPTSSTIPGTWCSRTPTKAAMRCLPLSTMR
jgi:VCBS repeat-containing protein